METKFQTSFIPKQAVASDPVAPQRRPTSFFTFLSVLVFIISVVVAGGAYGYKVFLESQKATMKADLDKNIKAFEPQTIEQYVRLDNRINAARELLSKHIAVSYFLDFLTEKTLQSVQFTDFKYDLGPDGLANVSMNGQAKSYNAVAYQSEVFGAERSLVAPIFSNLDLDTSGNVIFNFITKIDPAFIAYAKKAPTEARIRTNQIIPLDARPATTSATTSTPGTTPSPAPISTSTPNRTQ